MSENETQAAAEETVNVTEPEAVSEATTETEEATAAKATTETEATEEAKAETEATAEAEAEAEEISYHAIEKEGEISAIWEMQGKKHLRTISARSGEGQKILSLFTSEIHETDSPGLADASEATEEASA
jgi:hypothetical protein